MVRSIKENFDRDVSEPSSQLAQGDSAKDTGAAEGEDDDMVADLLGAAYTTQRPGQGEMRHGTGEFDGKVLALELSSQSSAAADRC